MKLPSMIAGLMCLLLILACSGTKKAGDAEEAQALASQGKWQEALASFDRYIVQNPGDASAYIGRSAVNRSLVRLPAALDDSNKAVELDPSNAVAYLNRATTFKQLGEYEKALADADKAIQIGPPSAASYETRASIYNSISRFDEAIRDATRAIDLDPKEVLAHLSIAEAAIGKGDYKAAVTAAQKAIELDPREALAYVDLGVAHRRLGDYQTAIADASKAIEVADSPIKLLLAYKDRGIWYDLAGQAEKSVLDFTKALDLAPDDLYTLVLRATAYSDWGQHDDEAIRDSTRAIELKGLHKEVTALALAIRARSYNRKGNLELAISDATNAIELSPSLELAYETRGLALARMKQYQRALPDFSRSVELDPNAQHYLNRAAAYMCTGANAGAEADLQKAASLGTQAATLNDLRQRLPQQC